MPPGVRTDIIKEAKSMGLRVFTEIGKKKPVSPMKSDDAIKAVLEDLEAGSEHVILESAETKLLRENNMIDVLPTIAKAVGLEHIYFEHIFQIINSLGLRKHVPNCSFFHP